MSDFVILTDSCVDLTADMVEQLDVQVLPLSFNMDGKTVFNYPDNREMDPHEFYDLLRAGKMATTSAVNVAHFTEAMEPSLQAGKDVLVLAVSSGLSTTYNSAAIAADDLKEKYPERKIYVVDTLCASMGQGLLVYLTAKEREKGGSIEQVRDWAENNKMSIAHQFTVNDLFHLKRGGRVSAATAVVGSMLAIKPVLHVNDEGRLVNIGKVRGRAGSLKALVDAMEKTVIDPADQTIFISHGDCWDDANAVADMVKERFGVKEVIMNYVGPVIGAHAGPGVVALFYIGRER